MLNRTFKKARNATNSAVSLARSGNWGAILPYLLYTGLGVRREMRARIAGTDLTIRSKTTDLGVAMISLRGEFDEVVRAYPTLKHNFVIDAGGYIGTAAIALAKAYPDALIVTVEPSEENFAVLQKNVAPYPNIRPVNAALGSTSEIRRLRNRETGSSGFTIVEAPKGRPSARVLHEINSVTVPELLQRFGKTAIDILKLDIEGGEHELLKDRPDWLDKVELICIELHDRIVDGCTQVYEAAVASRRQIATNGEKRISCRI